MTLQTTPTSTTASADWTADNSVDADVLSLGSYWFLLTEQVAVDAPIRVAAVDLDLLRYVTQPRHDVLNQKLTNKQTN